MTCYTLKWLHCHLCWVIWSQWDHNNNVKFILLSQLIKMARLYHTFLHSIITASSACLVMLPKWLITCLSAIHSQNYIKCSLYCDARGTAAGILLVLRLDSPYNYGSLPQVKGGTILSCGRPLLTASTVCLSQPLLMRRSSVAMEVYSWNTFHKLFCCSPDCVHTMTAVLLLSTYWSVIQSEVIQVTWLGLRGKEDLGDYLKLPITKSYTEMFKDKKLIVLEWVSSVSWKRPLLLQQLTTRLVG